MLLDWLREKKTTKEYEGNTVEEIRYKEMKEKFFYATKD